MLNASQIHILQDLSFMSKVKNSIISRAFRQVISLIDDLYRARLSDKVSKYAVLIYNWHVLQLVLMGSTKSKKILTGSEKSYTNIDIFKNNTKKKKKKFFVTNSYSFKFILIPVILFSFFRNRNISFKYHVIPFQQALKRNLYVGN